ncbi:MAG: zinc-ribbon domain-containing protein [Ruminococcus sp.]|nr:zinc-ribbon domain-containing protein [Ruminococcus sp.]
MENQCEPDPQFADLFAQVSDLLTQMDALKSELAGLDHAAICPSCGSKVSDTQRFCPECGCKNDSYGKWKAEAEAAEEARRAAKDTEQADRKARKAEKFAQETVFETTAETRSADDVILSAADATTCDEEY